MDADTVWSSDTPRILVADPDANVRSLYQDSFARCGCDVLEALDGRDALAKALVREPTLVITELRLPLLDGFSLCEILRRDRVTATVPIIALTTQPEPTDIVRAQDAGADIVLPKPAPFKKLLSEFSSLVARFGELRAKSEAARMTSAILRAELQATRRESQAIKLSGMLRRACLQPSLSKTQLRYILTAPPLTPPR